MIIRPEDFAHDLEKQRQLEQLAKDETLSEDIRQLIGDTETNHPFVMEVQSFCFFCAEKLTVPAVIWHGADGNDRGDSVEIWLHPKCAEQLAARIQRDVNELRIGKQKADDELAGWKRVHPT